MRFKLYLLSFALCVGVLVLWEFCAKGSSVPQVSAVWSCFIELLENGRLQTSIIDSLVRFCVGLVIGGVLAILLGLFLGRFKSVQIVLEPFIQLLRPISPIAWLPLIVLWFGIGEVGAIFVIVYAVFFPILLLTIAGVRQINPNLIAMAKNFHASEGLIFRKIIIPGAFLHISSGLKLAASIAWIHLVAGEMLGIQSGLGYLIIDGRNLVRIDMVIVAMALIGILGFFITLLFNALEKIIQKRLGGLR
ncbi:ABC transporter permease [Helicobacter sp.]|uniref:ABC transporter permease n=1 Tax=Helicobacter sp. TaxID=218 RepID=UPI0025B99400|nr:ABC transporter permease [Helicobacter sp.]MCI5967986.1 ABC transporter permease [Helicobacter sp.]MDY2585101.1 ABC transporter permease [Helicobacter sp.]